MKYILKHQSGDFQLNLSIDIEEFKRRVREGREIFTLFDIEGNQLGEKPLSFLDECEISVFISDDSVQ